jgi:hypothetical protein
MYVDIFLRVCMYMYMKTYISICQDSGPILSESQENELWLFDELEALDTMSENDLNRYVLRIYMRVSVNAFVICVYVTGKNNGYSIVVL